MQNVVPPSLPDLDGSPLWRHLLLESGLPLAIALGIAGLVGAAILNRRGRARAMGVSVGLGLVGAGLVLALSALVTTDMERLRSGTRELVSVTADRDIDAVERIVHPRVELSYFRVGPDAGLDHIREQLRRGFNAGADVGTTRITDLAGTLDGPNVGRTFVTCRTDVGGRTLPTQWRLDWRRDPGAAEAEGIGRWRVDRIELIWIPSYVNPG